MRAFAFALALAGGVVPAAGGQIPVHWTLSPGARAPRAGTTTAVTLTARIDGGWHLYAMTQPPGGPIPARITVPDSQPFALADSVRAAPPTVRDDSNFGMRVFTYEGQAIFTIPILIGRAVEPGVRTLAVRVRYQACSERLCLPPRTETLTVPVAVRAAGARPLVRRAGGA